jgi:hypothetical protein
VQWPVASQVPARHWVLSVHAPQTPTVGGGLHEQVEVVKSQA